MNHPFPSPHPGEGHGSQRVPPPIADSTTPATSGLEAGAATRTRARAFTESLSGAEAKAMSNMTRLLGAAPEQTSKLTALIGGNKDIANETLRICRGALEAAHQDASYLGRTIDCFHKYVVELKGSVSAHITCMNSLKGKAHFPNPLAIFGDTGFRVDTPTRQQLKVRCGEEQLEARLKTAAQSEDSQSTGARSTKSSARVDQVHLIGDSSAQAMSSPVYHLYLPKSPEIPGHLCGWQSASKLLEAYNTPLLAQLQQDISDREAFILEVQKRLGLSEETPLNLDAAEKATRKIEEGELPSNRGPLSKVIAERLALSEALKEEIAEGLEMLDMIRFSDTVLTPLGRTFGAASQSRGHLFTWLSRELSTEDARKRAPEWVVDDYDALRKGGLKKLPREEIEQRLTRLAAYRARCTFVRKESVFGALTSDLRYLAGLEEQVKGGTAKPAVTALVGSVGPAAITVRGVRDVTDPASGEIARAQVSSVKEACAALYKFREQACRAALAPLAEEFWKAIELFRPLFQENENAWREDCRSPSVPMVRLKETAAGLCFGQHDFAAVKEAFELLTCAPRENEAAFYRSKNIEDFIAMSRGIVAAYRKWNLLAVAFANQNVQDLRPDENQDRTAIQGVYPAEFKGRLKTAEEYAEGHDGLTPEEVTKRAEWLSTSKKVALGGDLENVVRQIQAVRALAGGKLYRYSEAKDEPLAALFQRTKDLVPAENAKAELKVVDSLRLCAVVTRLPHFDTTQPYFTGKDREIARALASIANPALEAEDELKKSLSPEQLTALPKLLVAATRGQIREGAPVSPFFYSPMTFIDGAFKAAPNQRRQLQMRSNGTFAEASNGVIEKVANVLLGEVKAEGSLAPEMPVAICFIQPKALIRAIGFAVHDYQRVDGVFAEQALVLSEQSGREFLNPSGLIPSDRKTWDLLKRKRSSSPLSDNEFQAHQRWVNRALVTQVETEYLSIESRLPQGRTATVRSGSSKNHGASLGDVAGVPNARELFPRPTPQPT